ncbi:MAG: tyrosine-type recombinase/integrase [Alphaproteobacteria bacterium]|nr:tyrosine-type recombinase/integrase [Alphaproteobacteria bacterium]
MPSSAPGTDAGEETRTGTAAGTAAGSGRHARRDPRRRAPAPILGDVARARGADLRRIEDASARVVSAAASDVKGAPDDYAAAVRFLRSYVGSSATVNAYRREVERLLQWAWRIERRSVFSLKRDDIEAFVRFAIDPPAAWIGRKQAPRFVTRSGEVVPNPDWRPFVAIAAKTAGNYVGNNFGNDVDANGNPTPSRARYRPSQAAVRSTFAVLSSFYDFLTEEGHLDINPVALIRQKSKFLKKEANEAVVRRISNLQWDYVVETAEQLAAADPAAHERTLFVMNCLLAMYLRVSELVADERSQPKMGDFRRDMDGAWWFHVTGKGNKDRTVAVSDAMLVALKRYRGSLGLAPLPTPGEATPLLARARGDGPVTSTRQVRRIVQDCFDRAYARMAADGLEDDAQDLRAATVHWLRHTGISEDVKTRPREHVRDDAGHASMATTDRYIESDRRERHRSGRKKPLKDL